MPSAAIAPGDLQRETSMSSAALAPADPQRENSTHSVGSFKRRDSGIAGRIRSWFTSVGVSGLLDPNSLDDPSAHHLHFHFYGQSHRASSRSSGSRMSLELEMSSRRSDRVSAERKSARRSRGSATQGNSFTGPPRLTASSRAASSCASISEEGAGPPAASVTFNASASASASDSSAAGGAGGVGGAGGAGGAPPARLFKGWQGSRYDILVDGVHEHRNAIAKRKRLRLLPEINRLVEQLWTVGVPRGVRMPLASYMDYHLSCFHFVTAMEEGLSVGELDGRVDLYDAWENALCDYMQGRRHIAIAPQARGTGI